LVGRGFNHGSGGRWEKIFSGANDAQRGRSKKTMVRRSFERGFTWVDAASRSSGNETADQSKKPDSYL
jgi:hypothetical protein